MYRTEPSTNGARHRSSSDGDDGGDSDLSLTSLLLERSRSSSLSPVFPARIARNHTYHTCSRKKDSARKSGGGLPCSFFYRVEFYGSRCLYVHLDWRGRGGHGHRSRTRRDPSVYPRHDSSLSRARSVRRLLVLVRTSMQLASGTLVSHKRETDAEKNAPRPLQ